MYSHFNMEKTFSFPLVFLFVSPIFSSVVLVEWVYIKYLAI